MIGPITSLKSMGLRARLILLILLAITPVIALVVHSAYEQQELREADVTNTAIVLAREIAQSQEQTMERARELLLALSRLPALRERDAGQCSALLADLLPRYPQYLNLVVAHTNGDIFCSARPMPSPVNVKAEPSFTRAIENRGLSLGEFAISKITGRPFIGEGFPVLDEQGQVLAVIGAILSVDRLNREIARLKLPPDSVISIVDRAGTMIARVPDSDLWVGKSRAGSPQLSAQLRGDASVVALGVDGIRRIYGLAQVDKVPAPAAFYVSVGFSVEAVLEPVREALWRNLLWLLLVTGAALALAWYGSDLSVMRSVRRLIDTSNRVAAGDRNSRAEPTYGAPEIEHLARQFNRMLDSLDHANAQRERLRQVIEQTSDMVTITALDGSLIYINQIGLDLLGLQATDDLATVKPERLYAPAIWQVLQQDSTDRAANTKFWSGEFSLATAGGRNIPFSQILIETKDIHGEADGFAVISRDISQHRHDLDEIHRLAFYDALTGLPNRRLLLDRANQSRLTSSRSGQHAALLFLDLDHFKVINDTLGHDVGDLLLQQVAMRLKACVRDGDSVARLGGDEFVVLLEGLSTHNHEAATQTESIAIKILDELGQTYTLYGHSYSGTASIGIVVFKGDLETREELLKKADVAMYQAKEAGRNISRFFDPAMQAAAVAYMELEKDLRRGLSQREFILHYQAQVDQAGTILGAEALIRWTHPERGLVSPSQFIALAEETGLILPLGQWVLETACTQLLAWAANTRTRHWTMAVNVSALQFAQVDFVRTVELALDQTGANPKLLKLELTESMLVGDVNGVIAKMNTLRALGVRFSLDDFGTGYSSLSYLKRLPLDQLKIDMSFVRDVLTNPNDEVIARTVVALGHSLGLNVIAEGVETMEQYTALTGMGCDAFQGYCFNRPGPAETLVVSYPPL